MLYEEEIGDYLQSDHFLFLDPESKNQAEPVLSTFLRTCREPLNMGNLERALESCSNLQLEAAAKKKIPGLLMGFFEYLESQGKLIDSETILSDLKILEKQFVSRIRGDSTVKGITHKKHYTDVGRNDACPCGSGKKFKKCCLNLIS